MPGLEPVSPTSPTSPLPDNNNNNNNNNDNTIDDDVEDESDFDESTVPDIDIMEGIPITARDTEDSVRERLMDMGGWEPRQVRVLAQRYFLRRRGLLPPRQESPATSDDNNGNPASAPRAAGTAIRTGSPEPYIPGSVLISPHDTVDSVRERLITMGGYAPDRAAELAERFFRVGASDEDDDDDDGEDEDNEDEDEEGDDDGHFIEPDSDPDADANPDVASDIHPNAPISHPLQPPPLQPPPLPQALLDAQLPINPSLYRSVRRPPPTDAARQHASLHEPADEDEDNPLRGYRRLRPSHWNVERLTLGAAGVPELRAGDGGLGPDLRGLPPTAYNPRRRENTTAAMLTGMAGTTGTTGTTGLGRAGVVNGVLGRRLTGSRLLTMPAGGDMNAVNPGGLRGGNGVNDGGMRGMRGMRERWDMRRPNIDIERVEAWGTQGRVWAPSWDVL